MIVGFGAGCGSGDEESVICLSVTYQMCKLKLLTCRAEGDKVNFNVVESGSK